jgi:hypothetical protein
LDIVILQPLGFAMVSFCLPSRLNLSNISGTVIVFWVECVVGYYYDLGACHECTAGSYCIGGAFTSQPFPCPATVQPFQPFGYYCPTGSNEPQVCPGTDGSGTGSITEIGSQTSLSGCSCDAGYANISPGTGVCEICTSGTYSQFVDSSCDPCPLQFYCATEGLTAATGSWLDGCWGTVGSSTSCPQPCGEGYYCTSVSGRQACPITQSTIIPNAISIADCGCLPGMCMSLYRCVPNDFFLFVAHHRLCD